MANPAPFTKTPGKSWPTWARVASSLVIGWHVASLLAAELRQPPASPLERRLGDVFQRYYELTDQGVAHRFYSDIGPTPILLAELKFGDGRPSRTLRVPDRSLRPRILYQRELALANYAPQWAESFAHHLARRNPGCVGVTVRIQQHINPSPEQWIEAANDPDSKVVNPDSEEFYSVPYLLGDFAWPPS